MQPSIFITSFMAGLMIGFWIKGQFREYFSTKKEYHIHMLTMSSICLTGLILVLKYKQYFFL